MKQYLTQIKQGLIFGITASIVICSSIYLLKATRSSTNPWWDASPNDLYVSNGETLKASKRNSLVDKTIWVGTLETKAINTVYQAATDGFIEITSSGASCTPSGLDVYVDNVNPPVSRVSIVRDCNSAMAVVKKWQYRKANRSSGSWSPYIIRRVPLGN